MTLREIQDMIENYTQKGSNVMSKIPILGGLSRLYRYPAEISRVLGGSVGLGLENLLGIDSKGSQRRLESINKPMFMSQDEWDRSLGTGNLGTQLLESVSVGAEFPKAALMGGSTSFGGLDTAARNALGFQGASGAGKVLPWIGGKIAAGAPAGFLTGLSTMPTEQPKDIPGYLGKSSAIGAGTNVAIGGIQEGLKALEGLGIRTSARAKGLGQKGDTTAKMGERLKGAKGQEGLALTAQGQIDKGVQRANELTQQKLDALGKTDVSNLEAFKNTIKESFKKNIQGKIGTSKLTQNTLYDDILTKIDSAQSLRELDDIAIEAGNQVQTIGGQYNPEGSLDKQLYDATRDAIVTSIKGISKNYNTAKSALSDVLSRINSKEMISHAFLENKGMGAPLVVTGSEVPIPRALWSLLGSAAGGVEQKLAGLGASDTARTLGTMGITEIASKLGKGSSTPQPDKYDTAIQQLGGSNGMAQGAEYPQQPLGGSAEGFDPIAVALQEQGFNVGQQQQPQQQFDMQRLTMDLVQAVSAGQMSPTEADWILGMMQQAYGGGQTIQDQIGALAQTDPQQAAQLLGQAVLSGQIDSASANTYANLLGMGDSGGGYSTNVLNANLAYQDLEKITNYLEGGEKGVPWQSLLPKQGGNEEAQMLDNAVRNIADTIARTRTGAAMNLKEEELYSDFAPTVFDTEGSRKDKLERLRNLFMMVMGNEGVSPQQLQGQSQQPVYNDYDNW